MPLTAHDVVWTMNYMKRWSAPNSVEAVKDWKAKNDTTVVARLRHRSVEMRSLWIYILPQHVWKAADNKDWERFNPPLPLVGSGPYTVTSWNPNGTTVMKRNPFFRRAKSNTGPERVLMTYYGDSNGAVTALEQNRLDVMPSDTLDVQDAQRLQRTSGVHVFRSPPIGLEYWVFNLAPHVTSRVHTAVVRDRAIRTGAGLGDRSLRARQGVAVRLRRPGQHAAPAQLRALLARPLGRPRARLPLRPGEGAQDPRAGRLARRPAAASARRTACAPSSSSPTTAARRRRDAP